MHNTVASRSRSRYSHPSRAVAGARAPRWWIAAAACAGAVVAAPRGARAQVLERFAVGVEGGLGTMLPEHQRTNLGYNSVAVQGSARVGFSIIDLLAVQVGYRSWFFPSGAGNGQAITLVGGLRAEPQLGRVGRLLVDGNAGVGLTGEFARFAFDVGLGFEFAPTRWLGVGPVVRYGHLVTTAGDVNSDAQYWSAGATASFRVPPRPAPAAAPAPRPAPPAAGPRDTDRDGVLDPDDLCVTEPAGAHPDPARAGCPARDTDRDGVYEPQDQCPTTPRGDHPDPERAGCPDADDDNDAVLNHADLCRTQHHGPHPDPARAGCPLPDRDRDSVPDPSDHCPDQPGAPHPDPMRNGCPGLVLVERGQIRINRPVFFATNRDRILNTSGPVLTAVADALRASPAIRRIQVQGHTDDVGADAQNLELSQRRAQSVMRWLVEHGIEPARVEARGFGEAEPLESNRTRHGRASNRRVEFHIVDPAPVSAETPH